MCPEPAPPDRSAPAGPNRRLLLIGLLVAVAYVLAAHLGFRLAVVAEQVTTVWATTGIALAALLLFGRSLWPAIWVAAFVANVLTSAPWWAALAIATGNALEAVAATWLLRRRPSFNPALARVSDVIAFILAAALSSTAISATIGVATLCAAGVQPWLRFSELWLHWWLGDALGALVVAPAVLTTVRARSTYSRRAVIETSAFVLGGAVLTAVVFGPMLGRLTAQHPIEYVIFCFVIAAAVRCRQPTTALVVLAASSVAIWNTVRGAGPFGGIPLQEGLVLLQVYMGVLAGTGLLLAAALTDREIGERRRAAAHAMGEVLGTAPELRTAAPAILSALCEGLQWQAGALWLVDTGTGRLRCLSVWTTPGLRTSAFAAATMDTQFAAGVGLPGRVWALGKAAWVEDVVHDANFPRAAAPDAAGLHGAFAFPICLDDAVLGVIECFTVAVAAPDPDLLRTMATVGNQVGQFVARKRGEAAVLEEQRHRAAILDSALDAIIGMDHRGVVIEFNPAAERIFGYTRAEALGRELADLLIPRGLRNAHRGGLAHYLATGEGPFIDRRVETTACHAQGGEFPVEVSITRVPGADPPRFTGFVRDVTARVQAERERELLLQRESVARSAAEAANRAKDDFLATLSHELRTPLNAIVGWTRMLLDGVLDAPSTRRALQVIDRNAHHQVQLVSDILDVSRIITGGLKLEVRPVDLAAVIGAALDSIRPSADAKQIHVRTHLSASVRLTNGDPHRLQQIVWNLLTNAVKFTPSGGTIDVDLDDAGGAGIRIRVSDNGAGIDAEFLPHVFERFRQADGSVSRQYGGLGLGLAIVRHLVELHGGSVRAASEGLGKGATFTVDLPRADFAPAPASGDLEHVQGPQPSPHALAGCHALVVDDEQDARELLAAILTGAGATVDLAASVGEALRHLDARWPDVLLADIGMPGADGFALIRDVRRREAEGRPHLPAAAVTAYASNRDHNAALTAGFDRYVAKPIEGSMVVTLVASMRQRAPDAS